MIKNGILILIAVIYSASLFAQPRTLLSGKPKIRKQSQWQSQLQ